jgi:hypothetical protein
MLTRRVFARGLWAVGLLFGLAGTALAATGDSHDHDHHAAGALELQLNDGAKWETDAPLRQGMTDIRNEMAAALPQIHTNELPAEDYTPLANRIETHLQGVFANCKLPPAADAQLHVVLARVYGGVAAMKDSDHPRAGAVQIVRALDAYADFFDHPGWKPLKH